MDLFSGPPVVLAIAGIFVLIIITANLDAKSRTYRDAVRFGL